MRCFAGRKGRLVSIDSEEEREFVQLLVSLHPEYNNQSHQNAWIGGSANFDAGAYVWGAGGVCPPRPLNQGYENWCPGDPNVANGVEHCVAMHVHGTACWYDESCFAGLDFFVVEFD